MSIEKNINLFIEEQFSSNYRENGALLVEFMECYYKWGQESGNFTDASRTINDLYDVDEIADEFLDFLHNEFLGILPKDLKTNRKTLIKNILSFYQSRGTEDAYKLLFRILYNQEINLYYPGKDILRTSDGKWYIGKRLEITTSYEGEFTDIPEIIGTVSGATARVENVTTVIENSIVTVSLYLTNIKGVFVKSEELKIRYSDVVVGIVTSEGLVTDPGYWLNTDGHLSSDKYLQDNFYYQDFSYEIQSGVPLIEYRDIATKTVHPAGTKLFGKVLNNINLDLTVDNHIDWDADFKKSYEYYIDSTSLLINDYSPFVDEIVVEKNTTESAGTGTISVNDGQILDFGTTPISAFDRTPISLIGTRKLLFGTGTIFLSEVGQPSGPLPGVRPVDIKIFDTDNSLTATHITDVVYGDRFITITTDYPFPAFTLENFNLIKTIEDSIELYVQEVIALSSSSYDGYATVTGIGTSYLSLVSPGDIIYIADGDWTLLVISVNSDTSITVLYNEIAPPGFAIFTDSDGSHLIDGDGSYLTEPV